MNNKPCECNVPAHKHGKTDTGFQRWRCTLCGKTWSDSHLPSGGQLDNENAVHIPGKSKNYYLPSSLGDRLLRLLENPDLLSEIHQALDTVGRENSSSVSTRKIGKKKGDRQASEN